MGEDGSSRDKFDSGAHTDKKRKLQEELPEMPLPKKIQSNQYAATARDGESDPESTSSNNFKSDSIMSTDDDSKFNLEYLETCSLDMPSTSSSTSYSSLDFSHYFSESTSSTNSSCNGPEPSSSNEQPDCPHDEGRNEQFGRGSDYSSIDQQCMELENLLYSNGVAPNSNYILSSGRCLVNRDDQKEAKKLTIDKEFEQYFSTLML